MDIKVGDRCYFPHSGAGRGGMRGWIYGTVRAIRDGLVKLDDGDPGNADSGMNGSYVVAWCSPSVLREGTAAGAAAEKTG